MNYEKIKKLAEPYYLWVLLPLVLIYGLDFLQLVLRVASLALICSMVLMTLAFIGGFAASIMTNLPGYNYYEAYNTRLASVVRPFRWGFDLCEWLMEEDSPASSSPTSAKKEHKGKNSESAKML